MAPIQVRSSLREAAPAPAEAPLRDLLDEVCGLAEMLLPGARCSVQVHDLGTGTLWHVAAPRLPREFVDAIDGHAAVVGAGACGTAVATGRPVLVADLLTHNLTARLAGLARQHGLGACWSFPLRGDDATLGAFSVYFNAPRAPQGDDLARAERCASLATRLLAQDAARRQEAEREAQFRDAAELLPGHIFVIQADGRRVYANAFYETRTGIPVELLQGDGWRAVLHPDDAEATLASYFAAFRDGREWEARFRIRMGDGTYRWFMCRVRPQHRPDGSLAGMVGMDVDIHDLVCAQQALEAYRAELEQRVAERTQALQQAAADLQTEMVRREAAMLALAQSQRMEALGRLTGGVAHGFNNLLAAIMGGFELIEQRSENADITRLAGNGLRACDRAAALVRQLLLVASHEAPHAVRICLQDVAPQWRDLIRHALADNVDLAIDIAADVWPLMADLPQLEMAILNLSLNARDAMPQGGRLCITAENTRQGVRTAADFVCIRVTDTGRGIDAEVLPHIFEPFFSTRRRSEAAGMGLAMVHAFIRHAGGEIDVASEPDRGTVFSLYLPRAISPASAAAAPREEAAAPMRHGRVLIVDDDDAVRGIAASFLGEAGYGVLQARGGAEALACLRAETVDVVLTDLAMPGMDGKQLAAEIRKAWPALAVIFVTGYAKGHDLAGEMTLQKPYAARQLLAAVSRARKPALS